MKIADIEIGKVYQERGQMGAKVLITGMRGKSGPLLGHRLYLVKDRWDEEADEAIPLPIDEVHYDKGLIPHEGKGPKLETFAPGNIQHLLGTEEELLAAEKQLILDRRGAQLVDQAARRWMSVAQERITGEGYPCRMTKTGPPGLVFEGIDAVQRLLDLMDLLVHPLSGFATNEQIAESTRIEGGLQFQPREWRHSIPEEEFAQRVTEGELEDLASEAERTSREAAVAAIRSNLGIDVGLSMDADPRPWVQEVEVPVGAPLSEEEFNRRLAAYPGGPDPTDAEFGPTTFPVMDASDADIDLDAILDEAGVHPESAERIRNAIALSSSIQSRDHHTQGFATQDVPYSKRRDAAVRAIHQTLDVYDRTTIRLNPADKNSLVVHLMDRLAAAGVFD